jgi:membrane-anchored protein YejM (alkaline phosphatase superfamily)
LEYGMSLAPIFDYEEVSEETNAVYEKVMPYIKKNNPSFVYLSLGTGIGGIGSESGIKGIMCDPDKKDICAGDMLNRYYESIIMMDAIIFDVVDRLQQEKPYKDKTVFLILSSHGRHTNEFHNFGCTCEGCRKLFMLVIGPGIKKNFVSARKRTLIDICPTVGALFNIPTPHTKGEVMKELFE